MEEELKENLLSEEQKEQILDKKRKEKRHGDKFSKKQYEISYKIGYVVFVVFLLAIAIVEYKLSNQFEFIYGYLATFCGVGGSISLTRGILAKEKSAIALGAIEIIASIAFFICFVLLLSQVM